jgi:hypothetical protein
MASSALEAPPIGAREVCFEPIGQQVLGRLLRSGHHRWQARPKSLDSLPLGGPTLADRRAGVSETGLSRRRDLSGLEPEFRHLEQPLTPIRKLLNMRALRSRGRSTTGGGHRAARFEVQPHTLWGPERSCPLAWYRGGDVRIDDRRQARLLG